MFGKFSQFHPQSPQPPPPNIYAPPQPLLPPPALAGYFGIIQLILIDDSLYFVFRYFQECFNNLRVELCTGTTFNLSYCFLY